MTKKSQSLIRWALSLSLTLFAVHACRAQLVIDSLDGEVTQHEVDTFINVVSATPIPTAEWTATITHNQLADGKGGMTLEGINYMAGITADIPSLSAEHTQLLNLAIAWNDAWLTHRNDLPLGEGRVMWTGNVEPVWPPNCPTCTSPTYYESEVGDTIGHMAHTAYNILNTPSIWNDTVPDGDPNNFGKTYLARAKTHVSMLEFTMSTSFTPYFIDPNTLLIRRPSTAQGYQSSFHVVNAWNVQMMLLNAYWRLAQCHFILGDNPSLAAMYKTIVMKSTDMFVQNAVPITAPDSTPVYDWGYGNFGDEIGRLTGEQVGVHASYDIWGLTRAYGTGYTTVPTAQQMKTYADTVVHEMTLSIDSAGAATYASFNDRCCSTATYNYLPYGFIFLTPYNTDIYKPAAHADINSGRQQNDPGLTAGILWAKHWIYQQSTPPDFSLAATPSSQTVIAGGSASYTVSVAAINGFSGAVTLGVSGLPAGATGTFTPASISGGSGSSTLTITNAFPVGSYPLTITGTSGNLSHSAQVTLVVNQAPTAIALSSNNNPSASGQTVVFTATVSPALATGTLQFMDNGSPLGSSAVNSGMSTYSTAALTAGAHNITASYSGDSNFLGSLSPALTQEVTATGSINTSTSLTAPPGIGFHQKRPAVFSVVVTASNGATPSGSVVLCEANTVLAAMPPLDGSGRASIAFNQLRVGGHNIRAVYLGDGSSNMNSSTSTPQTVYASPRPYLH